ncbi:MAG: hypothetical protein KF743_14030 [Fimbriimonadaceae bacterium]|nr:hypothetical protein [Fimbriimonadaceae bacterium]
MGLRFSLSDEHLELVDRESLRTGIGGHQTLFTELKDKRQGNQQSISVSQLNQIRQRLAKGNTGTWQSAYEAILSYFTEDNKLLG